MSRTIAERVALADRPGMRSGLVVLAASFVGHGGNYLYYVVAGRMVGVEQFAEISAMIALATLFFMPVNGLQVAAARDVARLVAQDDAEGISGYLRSLLRRTGLLVGVLLLVLLAVSPVLATQLQLDSVWLVVLAAVWIALGSLLLVGTGVAQGMQRFGLVAGVLAGPLGLLRALLLPGLLLAVGLAGSMLAMVLATVVGLAMVARSFRSGMESHPDRSVVFRPGEAVVALLAFSSLTNLDLLVAKAALPAAQAGEYAGALLLGKIALFAPAALAMVLLPRAAALLERGDDAAKPVLLTLLVTLVSGLGITGLLALPLDPVTLTFGDQFEGAAPLLAPLALVMTGAALLNVHLTFAMASRSRAFPVLLVVAALSHAALLAVLHDSGRQIVLAGALAIGVTLLGFEVGSRHGAIRTLARLRRGVEPPAGRPAADQGRRSTS